MKPQSKSGYTKRKHIINFLQNKRLITLLHHNNTSPVSDDYWFHINWMKVAHRVPIQNWYNQKGSFMLNYPPLQGYVHYFMGIIYKFIDPSTMFDTELNRDTPSTPLRKRAIRIPVLVETLIFYYPAVICFVTILYRKYSNTIKLLLISILLNFPLFVEIEHMTVQVNSPTLAFLLYSILFMFKGYYSLTAFFFALSIMAKQITIPCIIPIGFYVLFNLRKEAENKARPVLFCIFQCAKLLLIGIATLLLVLSPFLFYPETLLEIKERVFPVEDSRHICPVASFWAVIGYGIILIDNTENRYILFWVCTLLVLTFDSFALPYLWKKPHGKKVFWLFYIICCMNTYFFGYHSHEKHLQYTYLGFVFNFVYLKKFFCSFSLCASYSLSFFSFASKNMFQYYFLNILYIPFVYLFHLFIPDIPSQPNTNCVLRLYNFHIKNSSLFLKIVLTTIFLFTIAKNILRPEYTSDQSFGIRRIFDFCVINCFFFLFYVYSFIWTCFYVQVHRPYKAILVQISHISSSFRGFQL